MIKKIKICQKKLDKLNKYYLLKGKINNVYFNGVLVSDTSINKITGEQVITESQSQANGQTNWYIAKTNQKIFTMQQVKNYRYQMNVGEKMKKVIKSCPNCDKLIEFSSDDKKVKCKNCKSTYIIQRGKDDNINLVLDIPKSVFIIPISILMCIILLIVVFSTKSINAARKNNKKIYTNLQSISEISKSEEEELTVESLSVINQWNRVDSNTILINQKHLGFYLLKINSISNLIDVYKLSYQIDGNKYIVYTGVEYNGVEKKDKLKTRTNQIHGLSLKEGSKVIWGYDSLEDFYNDINNPVNAKIEATKGLYVK